MYIGGTLSPARNTVMVDQEYDEMMACKKKRPPKAIL